MNQRTLGRTGFQVSELGFGAAPAAFLKADAAEAAAMLNGLLDQGLSLIDTATSYPGSQAFIGQHLSARRGEFTLVSKVGGKFRGVDAPDWSAAVVTAAVDNALKELKTDHVDVMLLHSCDLDTLKKGEALAALAEAREAGKIRFAGYSGDNEAAAYAAGLPDVAVVETSINIVDQLNIDLVLPVAVEKNVGVLVKRPIANAAWKDLAEQKGMYQKYASVYTDRLKQMNLTPADLGLSGDPAEVWPGIALRFTLGLPGVTCALVGTTKVANAQKNIDAIDQGPLAADVVQKIRDAFKRADPQGTWTGQT
ncbi:MAG TPA: aldo/keto reductase [Tepidisphaeraceae bacterium]|jgi:aryl-alcohol dehydrogenase-like predicted oxidoreductase